MLRSVLVEKKKKESRRGWEEGEEEEIFNDMSLLQLENGLIYFLFSDKHLPPSTRDSPPGVWGW